MFTFAIILCSSSAFAQKQFGSVQGAIQDAEARPIPGVRVTASSELHGSATVHTDQNGRYRIEPLLPGIYQLETELTGFQSVLRKNFRISVGTISTVDLVLEPEKVAEYVTVEEETPQIDSTTTAISYAIPPEIIQGLPKTDDLRKLLAIAPGVGGDKQNDCYLVAYGASASSSRIWIDGVDISGRANGGLAVHHNYNWMEEAQVIGNGAPSEYGNYLGVIGNYVTRSGGNQFHGLFETFFHNQNFVSTNVPDPGPEDPFETWDVSAQVGGPIARDKLWFFSGFQFPYSESVPYGYDGVVTDKYPKFITKLTYKPNQSNTIQGFAQYNYQRIDGHGAGFEVLPEVTHVNSCHQSSWNATWISLLTGATTLEGRFGGIWTDCNVLPRNGNVSAHINDDTGFQTGNATHTGKLGLFQPQGNFALTHHAEDYLGSHEFKFGVQFQNSSVRDEWSVNGRFIYFSNTYYYWRYSNLQETNRFNSNIDQLSLHVHDTWNLNSRVALSLGLRWDRNRGSTDRGVVYSADPVAPRIGFIWVLREDRPMVIKAHYGDYYEALFARNFVLLSDQPLGNQVDYFVDGTWQANSREQSFYFSSSDNKQPFVRQFTIGIDQELPGGIAAGTHYIYRRWHNLLGAIDTDSSYEPVPYINPVTGDPITVYKRLNEDSHLVLTNPEGIFRKYDGVEVYLNRRFGKDLELSGSFVYSKVRGNSPNEFESSETVWKDVLNDPNRLINFKGRLINDPTFAWKFSGIYNLPYGLNLGWFFRHQSGDTWEPLVDLDPDLVNQYGVVIFGLPRGSYRLPSQNLLDLRIEKQFPMFTGQFRITADIYNVFNAGTVTAVEAMWGYDNYGEPISFVEARQIHLGLRYTF